MRKEDGGGAEELEWCRLLSISDFQPRHSIISPRWSTSTLKCLAVGGIRLPGIWYQHRSVDLKVVGYLETQMLRSHEVQFQASFQNFTFRISEKEAPPLNPEPWAIIWVRLK